MRFFIILTAFLLPLNVTGIDPADYAICAFAGLLLLAKPETFLISKITNPIKFYFIFFFSSIIISMTQGYETRFVAFIFFNILCFFIIYFISFFHNRSFIFLYMLSSLFVVSNIFLFFMGLSGIQISGAFEVFRNGRFLGTFGDPNFTGFCAVFAFIYFLDRYNLGRRDSNYTITDVALTTSSVVILLLTESRAAWGAGLVALLAYFSIHGGGRSKFIIPVVFLIFALLVTLNFGEQIGNAQIGAVSERLRTIFAQSDSAEVERFEFVYTRAALWVGLEHPLGVGPGMTSKHTGFVSADGLAIGSHNSFVQIFVELGWLALFNILVILAITIKRIFRLAVDGRIWNEISCRAIFALMMGQIVFAMAHDMIAWRIGWLVPSLAICVAFSKTPSGLPSRKHPRTDPQSWPSRQRKILASSAAA
jgi:O-Antigen ligase